MCHRRRATRTPTFMNDDRISHKIIVTENLPFPEVAPGDFEPQRGAGGSKKFGDD